MCTRVNRNIQKLIYNRKNIYVLTMKGYDYHGNLRSVSENFQWTIGDVIVDPCFYKSKINNSFKYTRLISDGMFHVAPLSNHSYQLLESDLDGWMANSVKIFLAVIPYNSYILYGENCCCSVRLNDTPSIVTNKLKLIEEVTSLMHLKRLKKQYKIKD